MAQPVLKIRLFVDARITPGGVVDLSRDQAHYLGTVMRLALGDEIAIFNGADGEWRARIARLSKRDAVLEPLERTRPQTSVPDLWLLFAPVKKARTDFIVEKAVELGAIRIQPVFTRHTNSERVRLDRLRAHAVEAAEQSGRLSVPELAAPQPLETVLAGWSSARRIIFCDESGQAPPMATALRAEEMASAAILVGPEGGFAPAEADMLRAHPAALAVGLGPRVLRADTAAVAALSIWQSLAGDWR